MTTEATTRRTPGTPCWVSLMVHDLSAIQDFYSALFGWEFGSGPQHFGPYVRALLDGQEVAGLGELAPDRQLPVAWTTYLATDDADATAEQIRCCGGTVGVGPLEADHEGRMTIASDPQGAIFGVWQGKAMRGTTAAAGPGVPVWNELVTRETATVGTFYQMLFDYKTKAVVSEDLDYLTLSLDGRPVAAIHGLGNALPRERGAHWMTYFEVADTDAAARRVTELGGHVLLAPRDATTGRLATVADPEGAVFTIVRSRARG